MNQQEKFWAGEFGDEYQQRNLGRVQSNIEFFRRALDKAKDVKFVLEWGAGMGENLLALRELYTFVSLSAVDINPKAVEHMKLAGLNAYSGSILDINSILNFSGKGKVNFDLSISKGVLIHVAPEDLNLAYQTLYLSSRRYILLAEYYNPNPVEIEYRGHAGKLWKRDFAGEMLDIYPSHLKLLDTGFAYHGSEYPQDDITWFLLEKQW